MRGYSRSSSECDRYILADKFCQLIIGDVLKDRLVLIAFLSVAIAGLIALALLYWYNRATFVWRADSGDVRRTVNRPLCKTLETYFSGFLEEHGFKLLSDPELDKHFGFWTVVFRSDSFDLMFGGRGEVLVSGRPMYRHEKWYSISVVFALLAGDTELKLTENNLSLFASAMEEQFSALRDFFSPQGEDTRSKYAEWEEKHYWRRMRK
jgi:hypothetical protein